MKEFYRRVFDLPCVFEGGTSAAAIWTFSNVDPSDLWTAEDGSQYLPLELIVRVFRSYKGDIEQGIQGSVKLRNPYSSD